jgi:acetyltransferase-like isoleucine patch superfamily enzyme
MKLHRSIFNWITKILPDTRAFKIKRVAARLCGIKVQPGTKICGGVKFYGNGDIEIGRDCWIGIDCTFFVSDKAKVYIGDCCDIAPKVILHTGSHHIGNSDRRAGTGYAENIRIGAGTWVGVGSTVLCGAHISQGSIIAAGSVITKGDYEKSSLLAGVPARKIKNLAS